jgi:hypothetical protein
MKEPLKVWKKLTETRTLTDYTTTPPTVKEWIEAIWTYDKEEDVMIQKEYDEEGKMITEQRHYPNETHYTKYNSEGKISLSITRMFENDHGDIEDKSVDKDGNTKEEKLEYDEKGSCIRKSFLENGVVNSYLEFEYDDQDRVVLTKEFENGKLEYYNVDVYVSENENLDLRYNALGELKSKIEFKKLLDKNTLIYSSYDGQEKLQGRKEEVLDDMGESIEQKIYDGDNNLTQETFFGENDERGYRKYMIERKYLNDGLVKEVLTKYSYNYF